MSLLLLCPTRDHQPWVQALSETSPSLDIQVWPDVSRPEDVTMALCWKHPEGSLSAFPNLKALCSMGAGVEHLLSDKTIPAALQLGRIVDPQLTQDMADYVLHGVMHYYLNHDKYRQQQTATLWQDWPVVNKADFHVGVMGLGQLGSHCAGHLAGAGFKVSGWSASEKTLNGVSCYSGKAGISAFLSDLQVLICLLPLTPDTREILNASLFKQLPKGACVINVARGAHLHEQDLLDALNSGHLRGACLDVFTQEPLPVNHPFWHQPQISITPHCASITQPAVVAEQIIENYHNVMAGKALLFVVDRDKGY